MPPLIRNGYFIAYDVIGALGMFAVVCFAAFETSTPSDTYEPTWVWLAAGMFIAVPIATRRELPLISLTISVVATIVTILTGVIPMVAMGAPVCAVAIVLYMVTSTASRRRSLFVSAGCFALLGVSQLIRQFVDPRAGPWSDLLLGLCITGLAVFVAWTFGLVTRERRRHAEETVERRTERAVAEERLRIARELHDIVAHSMSLIAVKAGVGNHVAEQRPEEAREALRVIEVTSRASLAEMRHLLGVLRSEVDGPGLAPVPGPAGIPALVERARSAGVAAELSLDDTAGLPEGVGLSVYRIVQEALTNVVRHAAPARCEVDVAVSAEAVRIEVVNDGPTVASGQGGQELGGHGLIGMRERVVMYGGTFAAGPRTEGGWRVSAVLPVESTG